jgi:hypothetical protein
MVQAGACTLETPLTAPISSGGARSEGAFRHSLGATFDGRSSGSIARTLVDAHGGRVWAEN